MDDTQQNNNANQQPADGTQTVATDMNMQASSLGDIAGMTPPPAPMQTDAASMQPAADAMAAPVVQAPMQPEPAPVMPATDMNTASPSVPSSPTPDLSTGMGSSQQSFANPMPVPTVGGQQSEADDYSYAEDLLDEILDSLDRIESKLEAIEKKVGQ